MLTALDFSQNIMKRFKICLPNQLAPLQQGSVGGGGHPPALDTIRSMRPSSRIRPSSTRPSFEGSSLRIPHAEEQGERGLGGLSRLLSSKSMRAANLSEAEEEGEVLFPVGTDG
jgi:hypothetical protein